MAFAQRRLIIVLVPLARREQKPDIARTLEEYRLKYSAGLQRLKNALSQQGLDIVLHDETLNTEVCVVGTVCFDIWCVFVRFCVALQFHGIAIVWRVCKVLELCGGLSCCGGRPAIKRSPGQQKTAATTALIQALLVQNVWNIHFAVDSDLEVNLSAKTRNSVERRLNEAAVDLFDRAQKEVAC